LFSLYAYEQAFVLLDFGKGSAAAIVGGLIIMLLGLAFYRALDRMVKGTR
jgi:multiple sugar transport system permease protein